MTIMAQKGDTDLVKILLADPRVSPQAQDDEAIRWTSLEGRFEVVKLLLADPRVSPQADDDFAIDRLVIMGILKL